MITLSLETWVSIGGFIAVGTGLYTAMRAEFRNVHREISDLRRETKADFQRLDDRVYALAVGLKPDIERAREQHRGA